MNFINIFLFLNFCYVANGQIDTYANVLSKVFFQVESASGQRFNLTSNMTYARQICPNNTQISFILHGWLEGCYTTEWVPLVINATLKEAGGCVVFMDYSYFSKQGYGVITDRYSLLREVLTNTAKQFGNYEMMHCFGFSFGARLCIGLGTSLAALNNGTAVIPRMDLCDPAGPGFYFSDPLYLPPQKAAKNVACIHTSIGYGTNIYNCHQNYKLGHCGRYQDANGPFPKGSHGLCPFMYYYAFTNIFPYNPIFKADCDYGYSANRPLNTTCQQNMIVGYRNRMYCIGDFLAATAICPPYVYNGTIYNYQKGKTIC